MGRQEELRKEFEKYRKKVKNGSIGIQETNTKFCCKWGTQTTVTGGKLDFVGPVVRNLMMRKN